MLSPRRLVWIVVLAVLPPVLTAQTPADEYPHCPGSFTSQGDFVAEGTVVFDTDALTFGGDSGGVVSPDGIAVFEFDSITIPSGTVVRGVGSRTLALVSRTTIVVDGTIDVGGESAQVHGTDANPGGPGGGAGGLGGEGDAGATPNPGEGPGGGETTTVIGGFDPGGGGGGFGGDGGDGGDDTDTGDTPGGAGGLAYGDLTTSLQGGSGGSSGISDNVIASGGGGGGAILLSAAGVVTVGSTGVVRSDGGNGALDSNGASGAGSGGAVVVFSPLLSNEGVVRAAGGFGGDGSCCGSGGSGGGGRILLATSASGAGSFSVDGGPSNTDSNATTGFSEAGEDGVLTTDFTGFRGCPGATVSIVKDTISDHPQDFPYTGDLGPFSLDDDADATLPNTATFTVTAGTYEVTEGAVAGYDLTALTCVEDATSNSTTDLGTSTATIAAEDGETITCTFENTGRASITIVKDMIRDGPQDFPYTGDLGSFSLDDDADATLPNTATFIVGPGTYEVTEGAVAGFDLTGLTCVEDATSNSTTDLGTSTATIAAEDGETITCTFENTGTASITIVKDAIPDDSQDFSYSGDLGAFTLDDDGGTDGTFTESQTFPDLPPGTYSVTEAVPAGWGITAIPCDDGNSSGDPGTATATVVVDPGEDVTCTFENSSTVTDVAVSKEAMRDPPHATRYLFVLTVTNKGPAPATNLVVEDQQPTRVAYVSDDCGASVSGDPQSGETVTWTVGTLALGEQATCTITVEVLSPGQVTNEATFTMDQADTNPDNDVGQAVIQVSTVVIPTLGTLGLVLLVLVMAGLGLVAMRP